MTETRKITSNNFRPIHVLCVDDPAVRLYSQSGVVVSSWSKYSGINVDITVLPWDKYPDTIFKALESGSGEFDIVMLPGYFWLPKFAAKGWLTPLDEFVAIKMEEWRDYNYEDILPNMREELELDGKKYLLPSFSEVQIIYYRKDILNDSGIPLPSTPLSINDWLAIARKVHDPSKYIFGTHFKGADTESMVEWLPFFSETGSGLPDGTKGKTFPKTETIYSLQRLREFIPYCREDVGESDNSTQFEILTKGLAAIVNHWSGQLGPILNPEINPFTAKYGFTTLENPWGTVWAFGIPSASTNQESAFDLLLQLTGTAADIKQADYSGSPTRKSSFTNEAARKKYPWFPALLECIERKNTFPSSENFADLMGPLYGMTHEIFSGSVTPETAFNNLQSKLNLY